MSIKDEIYRKSFHIFILIIPTIYHLFGKWQSLLIFAPIAATLVLTDYFRTKSIKLNNVFVKCFGLILREKEKEAKGFCGSTYVALASCLCFVLFKPEFIITSFIILAISDALASLIGKSIPSKAFFEKSQAGSIAFFISSLIIVIICGNIFHMKLWFYIFGTLTAIAITIIEARPSLLTTDDNFSIPVGFCAIMTFFDIVLNYNF